VRKEKLALKEEKAFKSDTKIYDNKPVFVKLMPSEVTKKVSRYC
jgi:hypothetical protein